MTIALAMIVRDEAATIERCLRSVESLVDGVVIVDTGSKDGTQQVIKDWVASTDTSCWMQDRPWVNFGHNRSELMDMAYGKADWVLLLDADHTVVHDGPPNLSESADSYMLRHADEPEYWVKRLVSGRKHWHFVGATHEFIATNEAEIPTRRCDQVVVYHHADGSHRAEKFERDLQLLRGDNKANPNDPRTVFYLANTLRDLGQTDQAIEMFEHRTQLGGWDEERYDAMFEIGKLTGSIEKLLEAWSFRPRRAEPLYEVAWRLRRRRLWAAAHMVAERAQRIPMPDDVLFVHRWVYEWGCEFELSIAAWHAGNVEQAREASDRLLQCETLPPTYREQVIENRTFLP